jgi:signal transduction histidine kinase/HPt (histidine-containing phosphotransfer) domain-containing protein
MSDVLHQFLAELGYALLEYRGEGMFIPVAPLPGWLTDLWKLPSQGAAPLPLSEKSPFLENFLYEAQDYWNRPVTPFCQSETWIEKAPHGREVPLRAKAILLNGKHILALFSPDAEFREQVTLLQTARNALLDHERLAREIQKKEILLHCIVHDLSQPLSVMHVAMDCLASESVSDRSKQFLTLGKLASEQQETMIRDILHTFSDDLRASLDAGAEENASTDLLEVARKTMTALGPTFDAKDVRLEVAAPADTGVKWPVRAEASRLQRIYSNLLENALRYTPSGARVTVGLEDEGVFLKAYVDDEGPGLPKDLRPEQIFGLFMKGKQSGGKAGLGLYFCRITVERWGGSIGCATLSGKGSRFWFRLLRAAADAVPAKGVESRASADAASSKKPSRPLRILFADDQKDIRTLTAYQLKRNGHRVVAAKNGKEALQRFRPGKFDAVLLDQEMPGLTGDQVARAIRKREVRGKAHTFLVASTGNTAADDVRRLQSAGFDRVLGKPFRLEDLYSLLADATEHPGPSAPTAAPSDVAVVDFSKIVERVGGDDALLKRMIATFLRDTPRRLTAIAAAIRKKDSANVASLAHALKGSISLFGAEPARLRAQELQELARSGDLAAVPGILIVLKEEIANLLENLRGYAQQTPARPASQRSPRSRPSRKRGKRRR